MRSLRPCRPSPRLAESTDDRIARLSLIHDRSSKYSENAIFIANYKTTLCMKREV